MTQSNDAGFRETTRDRSPRAASCAVRSVKAAHSTRQMDLFQTVQNAYVGGSLVNADLYEQLVQKGMLKTEQLTSCDLQDKTGRRHCQAKRDVRWLQQTLKGLGLLESSGKRGEWRLTQRGRRGVTPAQPRQVLLGFSTSLGIALWGSCDDAWFTTAKAAEIAGRRWVSTDLVAEYVMGEASRFRIAPGFEANFA